jgi:hypothetical protein
MITEVVGNTEVLWHKTCTIDIFFNTDCPDTEHGLWKAED